MTDGTVDPALARLGLAVIRGLLLDLVATDDDAGVDAAAQAFVGLVSAFRAHVVQDRHLRAGLPVRRRSD